MTSEKQYQKLKQKYKNLPDFKWLEENFNVKIKDDSPMLEQIREQMEKKILGIRDLIEPIIGASETYSSWFERKMITDREKEELFKIYKKLQIIYWKSNKIGLGSLEKEYVDLIVSVKDLWTDLKPALTSVFDKIMIGWAKYSKKEDDTSYHG